jgi:hypothetical protein
MMIILTLSTVPPVRTCPDTVMCKTTPYGEFISLAADISFLSPYDEKVRN